MKKKTVPIRDVEGIRDALIKAFIRCDQNECFCGLCVCYCTTGHKKECIIEKIEKIIRDNGGKPFHMRTTVSIDFTKKPPKRTVSKPHD